MYLCAQNHDLKRGGTFETAKAGTFHSVTAGTSIPLFTPDDELKAKMKEFQTTCYTIGNMAVLPDRRIGEWSINKHRGCHNEWHDYEDRFLEALYLVLTGDLQRDLDLEELVELNKEDFMPFYGKDGWVKFVEGNFLMGYVNRDYVPIVRSKGYTYWRGGYTNRDRFIAECYRYIDESTKIINHRAKLMIEKLKACGLTRSGFTWPVRMPSIMRRRSALTSIIGGGKNWPRWSRTMLTA